MKEQKVEQKQKKDREQNIIILRLKESDHESPENRSKLDENVLDMGDKRRILARLAKLKEADIFFRNIGVSNDMTKENMDLVRTHPGRYS